MMVDEVSVLMLDFFYLEGNNFSIEMLIGVGIVIDNKLFIMNDLFIELVEIDNVM